LAPFADNSFDGVYAIEATCHAPVREGVYSQIYRVLKPGQIFACYEWCLTPKYDANNELHRTIKKKIEEGDGLPDMASQQECVDALTSVGFEVRLVSCKWNAPTWLWYCCVLCCHRLCLAAHYYAGGEMSAFRAAYTNLRASHRNILLCS
jgi:SAM-dependent methyltransferase